MAMSTLEIKLSGQDVVPFVKEKLASAGIEFGDICGSDDQCTIFVDVEERQRTTVELGLEITDVSSALRARHVGKVDK